MRDRVCLDMIACQNAFEIWNWLVFRSKKKNNWVGLDCKFNWNGPVNHEEPNWVFSINQTDYELTFLIKPAFFFSFLPTIVLNRSKIFTFKSVSKNIVILRVWQVGLFDFGCGCATHAPLWLAKLRVFKVFCHTNVL